jgi:hypothetical protein
VTHTFRIWRQASACCYGACEKVENPQSSAFPESHAVWAALGWRGEHHPRIMAPGTPSRKTVNLSTAWRKNNLKISPGSPSTCAAMPFLAEPSPTGTRTRLSMLRCHRSAHHLRRNTYRKPVCWDGNWTKWAIRTRRDVGFLAGAHRITHPSFPPFATVYSIDQRLACLSRSWKDGLSWCSGT